MKIFLSLPYPSSCILQNQECKLFLLFLGPCWTISLSTFLLLVIWFAFCNIPQSNTNSEVSKVGSLPFHKWNAGDHRSANSRQLCCKNPYRAKLHKLRFQFDLSQSCSEQQSHSLGPLKRLDFKLFLTLNPFHGLFANTIKVVEWWTVVIRPVVLSAAPAKVTLFVVSGPLRCVYNPVVISMSLLEECCYLIIWKD